MIYFQISSTKKLSVLKSYKFTFAFLIWMAIITFLSLYNFTEQKGIDIKVPFIDKAVHFVFYFVATILACMFVRERSGGKFPFRSTLIYTTFFMLLYGAIIEVIQAVYTIERSGEIGDFAANSAGILLALFIVSKSFSPNSRLKWKY